MTKGTLEIHSENILPIIKKWLYSDHDIFVRELIANSCDALHKLKILRDQGLTQFNDDELRIDVVVDQDKKTISFSDTGIGMTAEEVQKYIAQIAFSSAEEFVEKYKSNKEEDQIIGHFGLGFYSSYMVAERVEIETLSYQQGAQPAFWSCGGSREYELKEGSRQQRGTTVTLYVAEEQKEYLDPSKIRKILTHYCSFLPYPIYFGQERINKEEPLWVKPPVDCTKEDYLRFYRHLYPLEDEPLFWVHLSVDYPFHLKGILYFPKIKRQLENDKQSLKLYCNRVFVSDNCKDVIPDYLMMLRGVVDSPDIPLNVSRSYLQMDRTVRQLGSHISKKVADSLLTLLRNEKDRYISTWNDISTVVKLGVLEDEKFYDRVKEALIWKNTKGEWTTIEDYLDRNREKRANKVFYTSEYDHYGHMVELYEQRGVEILSASSPIDSFLMQFLERKLNIEFTRIDASLSEDILDKGREKTILDAQGRSEAALIAELIKDALGEKEVEVQAKSLANDALPGFVMMDEQQRRMRDYMLRMQQGDHSLPPDLFGKRTFVVNTNNPLINALTKLQATKPTLVKSVVHQLYELSLLSQRELEPEALNVFVRNNFKLFEELAIEAVHE